MPKRKPTQVITHRIELQETERAALEAALAGRFVTNAVSALGSVFSGVGSVLAPFAGTFTALAAVWIGDRAIDEIIETVADAGEQVKENVQDTYTPHGIRVIESISMWLRSIYTEHGWQFCQLGRRGKQYISREQLANMAGPVPNEVGYMMPRWFIAEVAIPFVQQLGQASMGTLEEGPKPWELWADGDGAWITSQRYNELAYYHAQFNDSSNVTWALWKAGIIN